MHGTAFAAARPHGLAIDLAHHLLHIEALGDAMAMTPMRRCDAIAIVEMHHDAGAGGFFAGIEMHEARYVALGEFIVDPLFEFADPPHRPIGREQALLVERKWILAHSL